MKKMVGFPWPVAAFLFFALFLLSLTLHIWNLRPWGGIVDHQKAGSWGDLIAGLGTITAALVAYGGIYFESRRARAAEEALERRLNTQVYCWLEPRATEHGRDWLLCFENSVGVPIHTWSVTLAGEKEKIVLSSNFGPLRPHSSQIRIDELSGLAHASIPPISFTFTDPMGYRWTRTKEGRLVEEGSVTPIQRSNPTT